MKKYIFFFLEAVVFANTGWLQNPTWALPSNSAGSGYYDFNLSQPIPFPTIDPINGAIYTDIFPSNPDESGYNPSYIPHKGAANAFSNVNGELLFFVVGNSIFDGDGRAIYSNIYQTSDESAGFSEIAVIPNPANCEQYYIITDRVVTGMPVDGEPILSTVYSILDVTATSNHPSVGDLNPNAQGGLIMPFQDILTLTPFSPSGYFGKQADISIAATPVNSNGEMFLFVIQYISGTPGLPGDQVLLKFRLGTSGISYVGFNSLQSIYPSGLTIDERVELEVAEVGGNYRIATANNQNLIIFDLDGVTLNYIGASLHTPFLGSTDILRYVHGIEFNTTGELVYFTRNPTIGGLLPNALNCYSLVSNNFIPVNGAGLLSSEFQYSYIEIGTDGNLYMAKNDALAQISGINNPSTAIINANFQPINYPANYWDYPFSDNVNKRYTLPDQIDGMDYSAHFANSPSCCLTGLSYAADSYTATTSWTGGANQTWTPWSNPFNTSGGSDVYVYGVLTIPSGINVTIQNMNFYFHPDAEVIVERSDVETAPDGAKLTLSNTVFTVDPRCGNSFMWKGVDIEGWSNQPQQPINNSKQGFLSMFNNSRIEHALVGAEAQGIGANNRGGIIRTSNSTFRNNRIDVRIINYTHPPSTSGLVIENQCNFNNTVFVTEGIHNNPIQGPLYHAFLLNAGGIKFTGCDFKNTTPELYSELNRGYGIFNNNNKLTVIPRCTSPTVGCIPDDPCTFENLRVGIYSFSGTSVNITYVDGNEFTNNFYGVYLGSLSSSVIQRNNFTVLNSTNPSITSNQTAGLYLQGCTGYKVTENVFTQTDGNSTLTNSRGVVVHNSGEAHNEIYKNEFHDILVGGQSQFINGVNIDVTNPDNAEPVGLQWLCNNFQNNIDVDLYVSSGRIDYQQGYWASVSNPNAPFKGARNLFDIEPGDYEIVTTPGVQDFVYIHYTNLNTIPTNTLGNSGNDGIDLAMVYSQSCPMKLSTITSGGSGILIDKKNQLKQEIAELSNLIDGGSTQNLLNIIQNSPRGVTKDALLAASPYLSDEVLLAYLATNPTSGHVQEVLNANSPLSAEVLNVFNGMNYPNGIKNQVNVNQTGTSAMTELLNEISYLTSLRSYYVDELIRHYLMDTTVVHPMDSIIQVLEEEGQGDRYRKEQLCDALIIKADLAYATFVRSELISEYGESNYTDMAEINIINRLEADPIESSNADPVQLATIEFVADDPTDPRTCPKGEAMLYDRIYSQEFVHEIEDLILPGQAPKSMITDNSLVEEEQQISVYPNPTSAHLFVEFTGYETTENFVIEFYNLVGQKILSIPMTDGQYGIKIDVSLVPVGVYFVHVRDAESSVSITKVVVE